MSFFKAFFDMLSGTNESRHQNSQHNSVKGVKIGEIALGYITSIKSDYLFVQAYGVDIFIHITEAINGDTRQKDLNYFFRVGKQIEVVPVGFYNRRWKGSILIAQLFRKREYLLTLVGNTFKGDKLRVKDFDRAGLILEYENEIEVRISNDNLPVTIKRMHTIRQVNSLIKEGTLSLKIAGMIPPEDRIYTYNLKSKNDCYLSGIIENFDYIKSEDTIEVLYQAFPFKLEVKAVRPYNLDSVMEFVLTSLSDGLTPEKVEQITGLEINTIAEIREKLELLNYMSGWKLTDMGLKFIDAKQKEREINNFDLGGYFAGSAHPQSELINKTNTYTKVGYGDIDKLFSINMLAWDKFLSKTDQDLPYYYLKHLVQDSQIEILNDAKFNDMLKIHIRKSLIPDAYFLIPTPIDWFFGGLLSHFNPLSKLTQSIKIPENYCDTYTLIEYEVTHSHFSSKNNLKSDEISDETEDIETIDTVYYETNTKTFWYSKVGTFEKKYPSKTLSRTSIDTSFTIELPNGDRLETFRNQRIIIIRNL